MLLLAALTIASLCARADEGFFRVNEAELGPKAIAAAQSVLHLDTGPAECSATLVSKSGHVLTALHCLLPDLRQKGLLEESTTHGIEWMRVKNQTPENIALERFTLRTGGLEDKILGRAPTVVFLGKGLASPEDETLSIPNLYSDGFLPEDFAVLKFELKDDAAKPACVPLATKAPTPGTRVWAIGFPSTTIRTNHKNSDGVSRFVATGSVHQGFSESPWLHDAGLAETDFAKLDAFFLAPRAFLTDNDGWQGMSGGMFTDESGRLLGVYSSSFSSEEKYVATSALAVSAAFIASEARAILTKKAALEIFGCD